MITLTEAAQTRVSNLLSSEGENYKLRMSVSGKGCAGLTYGFAITDIVEEDDSIIESGSVTVLIDSASLPYLKGARVDYKKDILGEKFSIDNPNAKGSCGCGDSFTPY